MRISVMARFVGSMSWFYFERRRTISIEMTNDRDPLLAIRPKTVGLIGFDQVTGLHLVALTDTFATVALDDGYGNRIPCYEVHTVGVLSDRFRTETGFRFEAEHTLSNAPEL